MDRIVITGAGVVTPLGGDLATSWRALLDGTCALTAGDEELAASLAAFPVARPRLEEALRDTNLDPTQLRKMDPFARIALAAADQALRAGDWRLPEDPTRVGIVLGVGYGASTTHLASGRRIAQGSVTRLSPFTLPASMPNAAAAQISLTFGMEGAALTLGTACASGLDAISHAASLLRAGVHDQVLAGGVEMLVDDLGVGGMAAARSLARVDTDGDVRVVRPFDRSRAGTAVGSAAALFLLERERDALDRGARPRGCVQGWGSTSDAHHITAPHPDGRGARAAMQGALRSAKIAPAELSAIYAHGTGTPLNDHMEGRAIRSLFGETHPPLTSVKGQCGHTLGASGAVNLAFALETLAQGVLPATHPTRDVDPECGVTPVLAEALPGAFDAILINSFGFGGHNASLLLTRA
ncbi:MAG: beta-ketoacyl-[acyl-carrier-protein] synthase family protein [Planctomycetes bacterium]|nr:beta-ketoacyl-[acyl-carrier-protein] synthase family protein [Planctomycetota bacterium]